MSLPRLGIEVSPTVIKVIWLTQLGELKSIETIPLPVNKKAGEIIYPANQTLKRLESIPDRFRFKGEWEAALATEGTFTILWDNKNGKTLTPLLNWRSTRGSREYSNFNSEQKELIHAETGMAPSQGSPLVKLIHFLKQEQIKKLAGEDRLRYGNLTSWLLWQATDGDLHWTDRTLALRTEMFSPNTNSWSKKLLREFELPASIFPAVEKKLPEEIAANSLWEHGTVVSCLARQEANIIGTQPPPFSRNQVRLGTDGIITAPAPKDHNTPALSLVETPTPHGLQPRVLGKIPAAGSTVNWLIKVLGINRQTFNLWISPPWPDDPPLWLTSFYGTGAPFQTERMAGLLGFSETSSARHICQGLIISLLLHTRQIIEYFPDKDSRTGVTLTGSMGNFESFPALAAAIWERPTALNNTPHLTARGALIYSDWQFDYLQVDPWKDLHQEVVLAEKNIEIERWWAKWQETINQFNLE